MLLWTAYRCFDLVAMLEPGTNQRLVLMFWEHHMIMFNTVFSNVITSSKSRIGCFENISATLISDV